MAVIRYYTRSMLTNTSLWGWGVLFVGFWLALGAYVFVGKGETSTQQAALAYTADWYGVLALFSLSSLAVTIAYSIYYASPSLAYCFRYTRLRPATYLLNILGSSSLLGILLSAIMLTATYAFYSNRFGFNLPPADVPALLVFSALSGAFMLALSSALVLVVNNYLGLRNIGFVSFVPLLLSYVFGFGPLFTSLPTLLIYASPMTDIVDLLYRFYSGYTPTVVLTEPSSGGLDWRIMAGSLVAWLVLLLAVTGFLLSRIRIRSIEEARQV